MLALDLVYQYRKLLGKCEAGLGLDVEEILALGALEASFAPDARPDLEEGRRFRRERVELTCRLRGAGDLHDAVRIADLGPGGLECRQAPYVEEGTVVEVLIEDAELQLSYRFAAVVAWLREDDGDDFALGLTFVGAPVLVHYAPVAHEEDAVDRIVASHRAASEDHARIAA